MLKSATITALALLSALSLSQKASASPQKFAFSYEAKTLAKGQFEFENNVTWGHSAGEDGFVFEHELEYGINDHWQISALAEWEHTRVSGEGSDSAFAHAGLETIYQLSNPATDGLGVALLGEVAIGDTEFTLEPRILVSKDMGPVTFVYNVGFAALWEGRSYDERTCEFEQSFGINYAINPHIMVGMEAVHDATFPDWSSTEANALYVGPNIAIRNGNFWAALAAEWEVTNDEASSDFMLKVRVGFVF